MSKRAFDQASELEQVERDTAWKAHRSMMEAKEKLTADDSAKRCAVCSDPIPQARRIVEPGCQTCVPCQEELDRAN